MSALYVEVLQTYWSSGDNGFAQTAQNSLVFSLQLLQVRQLLKYVDLANLDGHVEDLREENQRDDEQEDVEEIDMEVVPELVPLLGFLLRKDEAAHVKDYVHHYLGENDELIVEAHHVNDTAAKERMHAL